MSMPPDRYRSSMPNFKVTSPSCCQMNERRKGASRRISGSPLRDLPAPSRVQALHEHIRFEILGGEIVIWRSVCHIREDAVTLSPQFEQIMWIICAVTGPTGDRARI